jgi:hypothetical protein
VLFLGLFKLVSSVWAFSYVSGGAGVGLCASSGAHGRKAILPTLDGEVYIMTDIVLDQVGQ